MENRIEEQINKLYEMTEIDSDKYIFCFHKHLSSFYYSAWPSGKDYTFSTSLKVKGTKAIIKKNSTHMIFSSIEQREMVKTLNIHLRNLEPVPGPKDNLLITGQV